MKSSYTIVFFGTSEFGAIILQKMVQAGIAPVLVVTTPDMPTGRNQIFTPPPVKVMAEKLGIPLFQPEKMQDTIYKIQDTKPDLIVLAAYGKIIPKEILEIPKYGALNVHPSLLPKYRGPSPVQYTILEGAKTTGVSVLFMDEEIDHGPILTNDTLQITNDKITYNELHNKLAEMGAELLIKTIPEWVGDKIKPMPQDNSKATYTKKLTKEDGRIDWSKPARYIERQVRALYPWPGTFTTFQGKRLKILKAKVFPSSEETKGKLVVQTGKGALLIEELQLEGGKPMNSKEFLLGHKHVELL